MCVELGGTSVVSLRRLVLLNFGLLLQVNVHIPMEEVIKLSEVAGEAIMTIYNSAVRRGQCLDMH